MLSLPTIEPEAVGRLPRAEQEQLFRYLTEIDTRIGQRKFDTFYPETGPLRRELYPKHMEFFRIGATYRERCFRAANRVGKTEGAGGYEMTCHLTGEYPDWWVGRRFANPTDCWAAGKDRETTRDILQKKLLGDIIERGNRKATTGTGMIPGQAIGKMAMQTGIRDAVDTVRVKHKPTGGWSLLGFKSYAQDRDSFEGTEKQAIWLDEEPPLDIYSECIIRTAGTAHQPEGVVILTFTPLEGMSHVVLQFTPVDERPNLAE